MAEGQPIHVSTDLDGVQFEGPTPFGTVAKLLLRRSLHVKDKEITPYKSLGGLAGQLQEWWELERHIDRNLREGGLDTFREMKKIAYAQGREISFSVLSGRKPPIHDFTAFDLGFHQFDRVINEYELNPGTSSALWKKTRIRRRIDSGATAIHIEDDLEAALAAEEAGALVYLFKNATSWDWLLKWAEITLPENIIRLSNFDEIPPDFENRLKAGKL